MPTLTVDLNRDGVNTVETPDSFSADRSFAIEFVNHGQPVHVHLNLDDELSSVASLATINHYIEGDSTRTITVRTAEPHSDVTGRLKIAAGHGTTTVYIPVTVEPPTAEQNPIQIDESLSKPPQPDPEPTFPEHVRARLSTDHLDDAWLPAIGFALLAVVVATAIGLTVDSTVVLFGTGIVVVAAVVAASLVLR